MNWGLKIALAYTLFAGGMIFMAIKASSYKLNLVTKDYYSEELNNAETQSRKQNTLNLGNPLSIVVSGDSLKLTFPPEAVPTKGTIHLYRPSDSSMDKKIELTAGQAQVTISVAELQTGMWRTKITWDDDQGKGYFTEDSFMR